MSVSETKWSEDFAYGVSRVLFPLFLLISLDGLYSAESAEPLFPRIHDWWYLHLAIGIPWFFVAMTGATIWLMAKRQKLDRNIASTLLMSLSFIVSATYEVIGKFVAGH